LVAPDPVGRGPLVAEVDAVVKQKSEIKPEEFDVAAGLILVGQNYDAVSLSKLAAVPAQTYFEIIYAARGTQLRELVLSVLEFRRIGNASDDRMVGSKSRLNALRIKKYGVSA